MTPAGASKLLGGGHVARQRIGERIERLIALLDAIDGDAELEADEDFGGGEAGEEEGRSWRDAA